MSFGRGSHTGSPARPRPPPPAAPCAGARARPPGAPVSSRGPHGVVAWNRWGWGEAEWGRVWCPAGATGPGKKMEHNKEPCVDAAVWERTVAGPGMGKQHNQPCDTPEILREQAVGTGPTRHRGMGWVWNRGCRGPGAGILGQHTEAADAALRRPQGAGHNGEGGTVLSHGCFIPPPRGNELMFTPPSKPPVSVRHSARDPPSQVVMARAGDGGHEADAHEAIGTREHHPRRRPRRVPARRHTSKD